MFVLDMLVFKTVNRVATNREDVVYIWLDTCSCSSSTEHFVLSAIGSPPNSYRCYCLYRMLHTFIGHGVLCINLATKEQEEMLVDI